MVLLLCAAGPAHAVLLVQSAAVDATNPSNFLLASEASNNGAGYDREAVNARFEVALSNPGGAADSIELEVTFSLVEQGSGTAVALATGGTTVIQTETFNLGAGQTSTESILAALEPAAVLPPQTNYRVKASARQRVHGGAWSAATDFHGTWRQWIHFTNTTADDPTLNVKVFTGASVVTDRQILKSVVGQEVFRATLPTTLYRYDIESVAQAAVGVPVSYSLQLIDTATMLPVALAQDSFTVTRPMLAGTADAPPDPVVDVWDQEIAFAPAAGVVLDPTADYELHVTVETQDPDLTPIPAVPELRTSAAARYLVLSGKLWFGGVETIFTQLANDPSPPMVETLGVFTTQLAVQEGSAPNAPGRRFGDGVPLDVTYEPESGDATVNSGTQSLTTTESDIVVLGGLRFVRGVMRMDATGVVLESGGVIFPAGFGISTVQNSRRHEPGLNLTMEPLNPDFTLPFTSKPVNAPSGQYFYAFCDRLPIRFRTSAITWNVAAGTFSFTQTASGAPGDPPEPVLTRKFQDEELAALAPLLADANAAVRPSNDAFLKNITDTTPVTIATGAQGQALLTVSFDLGDGQMQTHYPQGVTVAWSYGRFSVEENLVSGPNYMDTTAPLTVGYKRDCDGDCGVTAGPGQMVFAPADDKIHFTTDGGMHAQGGITPERLRWGTTQLSGGAAPPEGGLPFAHQTNQWTEGAFHAAGFWLAGDIALAAAEAQRAECLLLSGVLPDGSYERPLTSGYRAGLADYPGLNLRVGAAAAKNARSVLAGISTPDYDLKARCKYYLRAGGVTGIHEAVTASFPSGLVMYGFGVMLDGFRLAFRDGLNVESKTGGAVFVPSPVPPNPGFELEFQDLGFKCQGQPHKMRLATEGATKTLAYWGTDIVPLSVEFANPVTGAGCTAVDDGFLMVGVQTRFPSVTPQKLHATLGFESSGNLVTANSPRAAGRDIDSRFTLPPNLQVLGAGNVPWEVSVAGRAYLNNPLATAPGFQQPPYGFLTFPATINVPWFEDMKVQFHVSALSTANPATTTMHVMGGWPSNPADGNGSGWQSGGQNYFTNKQFDIDHLAFPPGMSIDDYREPHLADYNPRARKSWLNTVDFDFNLIWDGTQRNFSSLTQIEDLLVLGSVHRQVQSLSPSTAELTFGLELEIPRVNTASLTAAVKEGIASVVGDALSTVLGGIVRDQLGNGLASLDLLMSERQEDLWRSPLHNAVEPFVAAVLAGDSVSSQEMVLKSNLAGLPGFGLDSAVAARLTDGIQAVDVALSIVGTQGDRTLTENLVKELLARSGVSGLTETAITTALAEVLPEIDPNLERAREVLTRARATLVQAQSTVATQMLRVFQENTPAIHSAADLAIDDIEALMLRHEWQLLDNNARRDRIRRLVGERVMACAAVPKFQFILRQQIQDSHEAFNAGVDNIFGQVNQLMRSVIESALGNTVLPAIEYPAVGDMGPSGGEKGKLAALNIDGYARINDESLRQLDIHGEFEFNLPDSLKVQANLRILEIDANTPPSGCRTAAGQTAAIVQVDARAECDWVGADGTILEVGAKFSLLDGDPVGFDGYFAFTGDVSVGPVTVNQMRLMAGFGTNGAPVDPVVWAYIGGKARGLYGGYEAAVGVFLGRTCNTDVLRMVDSSVGLALDESRVAPGEPITGVYFYGESWFPLNEVFGIPSTCMLTLKGGAGSGFFAFIGKREGTAEDAVFIGCKQLYGVEGTVLCALTARGTMSIFGALALDIPALPLIGSPPEDGLFGMADSIASSLYGGTYVIRGEGTFDLEFGWCPICVELSRTIGLTWTMAPPKAKLGISF